MVVLRCAWHPRYRGYPKLYGVASWRGGRLVFEEGMCRPCRRRWLSDFRAGRLELPSSDPPPPPLIPSWMPPVGVALALLGAFVLAARPFDPGKLPGSTRASAPSALASTPSRTSDVAGAVVPRAATVRSRASETGAGFTRQAPVSPQHPRVTRVAGGRSLFGFRRASTLAPGAHGTAASARITPARATVLDQAP